MRNKAAELVVVAIVLMHLVAADGQDAPTPPPSIQPPPAQSAPAATDVPAALLSQADLEEMLGPIALYPDTLLANVMAAAVYPDELVAAHAHLKGGGLTASIDQQPWEAPVKSIAKVPEAINFLVDNIEWTTAIGEAYIAQSQDVMAAIQSLRSKAKAGGALQSTQQMSVVESGSNIIIEPSSPDVIYVPQYDPQVVYVDHHDDDDFDSGDALVGGMIGFGVGLAVGEIFDDDDCDWDCDWDGGHVDWDNDIDIDRDTNFERNVDRNRETNIETGDININSDRSRNANSIGREGQPWQPNNQKVQERRAQTGGVSATENFRGVSGQQSAARNKVPTRTSASTTREAARPVRANNQSPGVTPASEMNRQRAGAGTGTGARGGGSGAGAREAASTRQSPRPATSKPPERQAPKARPQTPQNRSAAKPNVPKPKTAPPRAPSRPPSNFSPSGGSAKASSRGASSRSSGARSGGGGRGGGGGGGRGGGGRR